MADQPTYIDLSIRIRRTEENRYTTVVSAPDGSAASGSFVLPFSKTEIDNFVLRVGRQRLPVRSYRSTQMEEAKRFGSRLFEALMVDDVRDVFRRARTVADSSHEGVRVTLCLTEAPELMDLPWEFLYERPRFLAQSIYSPVVRSLDLSEVREPHPLDLPLHVLGMVSSPRGFGTLDVEREKEKVTSALEPLCRQGAVTIEWLENGTLRQLDEAINRGREVHAFHYIGHGAYDPRSEGGILVLENERGDPHEVSGEELGLLLQDERGLRLAVLNSCEGARSSHLDPFSGVASSLVHYGVPAVIGMQFEITDEAAIAFSSRLYASLAQGLPVDAALAQARRSIFAAGNDIEFGTPVLFLRGASAQLFELLDSPDREYLPTEEGPDPLGDQYVPPPEPEPTPEQFPLEDLIATGEPEIRTLPSALTWLPKPWQEWLVEARWNTRSAWRQWSDRRSNRRLALRFGALLILGSIITAVFGHETSSGTRENPLGTILVLIGFVGLVWVCWRVASSRIRRLRDWWTGSG